MKQTFVSQSSREGSFVFNGDCEYWDRPRRYCSVGMAHCIHNGKTEDCRTYTYYCRKLLNLKQKGGARK